MIIIHITNGMSANKNVNADYGRKKMKQIIEELKNLIHEQLELAPDDPLMQNYKSRTIANYTTALKNLIEIERKEKDG